MGRYPFRKDRLGKGYGERGVRRRWSYLQAPPERPLVVTVPLHRELRPGLLRRLMRDAGISREERLDGP
jgi:predicted RNA binding protein YcfA (HicA-like mRNA interferase family)